jgi:pyruvate kinase
MANNPRPTRAEVSDVANAIIDGTDAVMLSNETAVGKYPVEAVATMARIAERIEQEQMMINRPKKPKQSIPNAIAAAVSQIAQELNAAAIMTLTKTGATARNVSKFRPQTPILAVTPHREVAQQLQLVWGVNPLMVLDLPSTSQTFQAALNVAQEKKLLVGGDMVVMTAGTLLGVAGSTDLIKVEIVKTILGRGISVGQGMATGPARVAKRAREIGHFSAGEILVVPSTSAEFVEMMRIAAGIITEDDNPNGHAAVIGSKLNIPVIIGFQNATDIIRDGAIITLDAARGLIYSGTIATAQGNGSVSNLSFR